MPRPYRLMVALFAVLGALAALDAALAALGVTPFLTGLRWLRVHAVTLGIFTGAVFGLLPGLAARRAGRPAPPDDHGRWLLLQAGLVTLLVGIPLVRPPMIGVGGTLVVAAALWLAWDARALGRRTDGAPTLGGDAAGDGQRYALAGLAFLAVGALLGTGLWLGWAAPLRIATPKEAHVHAVVWGFASLLLGGWIVDLARWAKPAVPSAGWRRHGPFALLVAGAGALLAAPWLGHNNPMIAGIVVYAAGTAWLAATALRPLARTGGPGAAHLLTGYLWILVPATALPFVVLGSAGLPVARVESVGPSILAYGWLLQVLVAILPPATALAGGTAGPPGTPSVLGGTWPGWVGVNGCALALVASIALPAHEARLSALAFALLAFVLAGLARRLAAQLG